MRDIVTAYPRLVGVKIYLRDEGHTRRSWRKDAKEIGTMAVAS